MINNTALQLWERLAAKQLDQMFKQRIIEGLNCSPFEAEAILQNVHDTYAAFFQCAPGLQPGQLSLQVVSIEAPPGPRLTHCPQILVTLTWEDPATDLAARKKGGVAALRRHRLVRVCHEAFQQGGLLTLEDLAYRLFNCGQRPLCRDLYTLRQTNISPPLRSTIKDIGRTLSHRRRVIELWLAGQDTPKSPKPPSIASLRCAIMWRSSNASPSSKPRASTSKRSPSWLVFPSRWLNSISPSSRTKRPSSTERPSCTPPLKKTTHPPP